MTDKLLTIDEVCDRLSVSRGALAQLRYEGTGPKFIKLTAKAVRYRESDIEAWLDERVRSKTAAAA